MRVDKGTTDFQGLGLHLQQGNHADTGKTRTSRPLSGGPSHRPYLRLIHREVSHPPILSSVHAIQVHFHEMTPGILDASNEQTIKVHETCEMSSKWNCPQVLVVRITLCAVKLDEGCRDVVVPLRDLRHAVYEDTLRHDETSDSLPRLLYPRPASHMNATSHTTWPYDSV
ncbi:hypothetical protein ONZ51_g11400 [Trametes cubensis]|uniref:Uncharacterized protein n=1 Tax=Trametes cubensis TaxID=1111947 RepID=A0AAD7TI94_9APHY|nr:hypothetical protein ONZ51_g11400 [Trametes cubensis]